MRLADGGEVTTAPAIADWRVISLMVFTFDEPFQVRSDSAGLMSWIVPDGNLYAIHFDDGRQTITKDLPAIAGEVGEGLTIFAIALLISVLLCVCTVCACLVSCCYSGVNSRSQYKEVPSVDHDFPPVKGKKFEEGTSIKV